MNNKFLAWDWDSGEFVVIPKDNVVDAIYWAWNYEFVVYDMNKDLVFTGMEDNEFNSEMLKPYGLRVINHERHRHLQNVETGEIYKADWQ